MSLERDDMTSTNRQSNTVNRRAVLQGAAGAVALAALPTIGGLAASSATAADKSPSADKERPWIDAHTHLWSPNVERWPLAGKLTKSDLAPPSFTPEEFWQVAKPFGIGRAVLIQHHTYHGWDNTYLIDCAAESDGRFVVVGMVDDRKETAAKTLRELSKKRVRGLRITSALYGKDKWLDGPGMASLWKTGPEVGVAMCCLINPDEIPQVDAMCQKHPETTVVIDHFARVGMTGEVRDAEVQALCDLAKNKRVHVKLSAYYALGKKQPPHTELLPMVRRVLDAYGPERCMWASDCPYQIQGENSYAASLAVITEQLKLSAGDKQQVLAKTAEKVFFA